ncbi:MAG: bifunctional hydroxymethylpyrimidine kinase/phosphomethylpyrimidine kinase [Candidatus Helarchaeota archaeon]|nr:bifunctional hydroxymethylpyrimidine kinase/phosphomethylpyrimidine kinase [Candidatus Helarchaeota archaeon]
MKIEKVALTIAGSDSSAGAGIQADLKTFAAHKVFGVSVITAITAQNTMKVSKIFKVPIDIIEAQLDAILEDVTINAIKTGMLVSTENIELVASKLKPLKAPLVVDPIIKAGTGRELIEDSAIDKLKTLLLPLATIITPNIHEAEILSGIQINSEADAMKAGEELIQMGANAVLIKGRHFKSKKVVDLLFMKDGTHLTMDKKRNKEDRHGSGCVLSASITSYLALDWSLNEAVANAEEYMNKIYPGLLKIGHGTPPINPFHELF